MTTTTRTRRRPAAKKQPAVNLTKQRPEVAVRPERVIAGGLEWRASEDDAPFGAVIGWTVAVRLGVAQKLS